MESIKRVMLATAANDTDALTYPLLASPKIDGIRAINKNGQLLSRSMKLIPNGYVQSMFSALQFNNFDGELVCGNPYDHNLMQQTSSAVMTHKGEPDVHWYIFDYFKNQDEAFGRRLKDLIGKFKNIGDKNIHLLPQTVIRNKDLLKEYQEKHLKMGYEGIMVRSIDGPYKQGRSTLKQGYLLKVKQFEDSEAEIISVEELQHNENEATTDERGYTKRSSHNAGKVGANALGAVQVRDIRTGVEFSVGTGFTKEQRENLWQGKRYLIGKLIKYKSFSIGVKEKPRFPIFLGFRDRRDI